jgi:ATP-binding cassette, subfamily B, bacterial
VSNHDGGVWKARLPLSTVLAHARSSATLTLRAAPLTAITLLALSVVSGVLPVATTWLTKLILDRVGSPAATDGSIFVALGVGLAVVGAAGVVLTHATQFLDAELSRALALGSQRRLYEAVNRLHGLASLEQPRFHDRLQLALHAGRDGPGQLVHGLRGAVQSMIMTVGFLGTLAVLSPWMLAVVLVGAAPTLRIELGLSRRRAAAATSVGPAARREIFFGSLLTRLDAAKEVRLFGLGGFFRERMFGEIRFSQAANRKVDLRTLVTQGLLALLSASVTGAGLVWAVRAAARGDLTAGDISAFVASVAGVQFGLSSVAVRIGAVHNALLLFDHYQAIVTVVPDLVVAPRPLPVPPLRHGVEFRDVWFRYGPEHSWVLRGVNLTIPYGRSVGLVGLNGAGKSTIVKLLCRFYDPDRGSVEWDGIDIRLFEPGQLRSRIGAVFQDFMEYEMSAHENIGVGDLSALGDPGRITAAAKRADIHDAIVALPRRYDTMLSRIFAGHADEDHPAGGVLLSGGQWQRIALARAFVREDTDVLLLDEPSAGLDAAAEYQIHKRLHDYRRGRASLLISHRLAAVRDADQIVVLRDGVVVEEGDHEHLMHAEGAYAELFALQAAGYQSVKHAEPTAAAP